MLRLLKTLTPGLLALCHLGLVHAVQTTPPGITAAQTNKANKIAVSPSDATAKKKDYTSPNTSEPKRPFTIDDLFRVESVSPHESGAMFSPDGKRLALVRVRPRGASVHSWFQSISYNEKSDVWVQLKLGAKAVNLTNGHEDGSGWFAPQWSPDGRYLAMQSTRGRALGLWMWDAETRQLQQLSRRAPLKSSVFTKNSFVWVDSEHVLYAALSDEISSAAFDPVQHALNKITQGWTDAREGTVVTASSIESGVPPEKNTKRGGDLLLVDISGRSTLTASGILDDWGSWRVSPDRKSVAYVATPVSRSSESRRLRAVSPIRVAKISDGSTVMEIADLNTVYGDSIRWSPDGRHIAVLGSSDGDSRILLRIDLRTRQSNVNRLPGLFALHPWGLEWTADGELLLRAEQRVETTESQQTQTGQVGWWRIRRDEQVPLLTGSADAMPSRLYALEGRRKFVAAAQGKIWLLDTKSGSRVDLAAKFQLPAEDLYLSWPAAHRSWGEDRVYSQIIISTRVDDHEFSQILDMRTHVTMPLKNPGSAAKLEAYSPTSSSAVFFQNDRNGMYWWRVHPQKAQPELLAEANGFLRDVAESGWKKVTYKSRSGEALTGWILLPYRYDPEQQYPLIVWVYPGNVWSSSPPTSSITQVNRSNLQIAAARGYAVLVPSMPLSAPWGSPDDPFLKLSDGVLPAVEAAVQMRIADPDRIFLMGWSYGGFATCGLVTQTNRFKAAVAIAGLTDLISGHGVFPSPGRYTDHPQEEVRSWSEVEGALRMSVPPWENPERYVRNSPIFYVQKVETPLMLVHGDLDVVVPMQHSEEFFRALHRLGKRAAFVRYWGENHGMDSPANVRDMWERVFSWFSEFDPLSQRKKNVVTDSAIPACDPRMASRASASVCEHDLTSVPQIRGSVVKPSKHIAQK